MIFNYRYNRKWNWPRWQGISRRSSRSFWGAAVVVARAAGRCNSRDPSLPLRTIVASGIADRTPRPGTEWVPRPSRTTKKRRKPSSRRPNYWPGCLAWRRCRRAVRWRWKTSATAGSWATTDCTKYWRPGCSSCGTRGCPCSAATSDAFRTSVWWLEDSWRNPASTERGSRHCWALHCL